LQQAGNQLLWLAHAFERHLALLASRGHRKTGTCAPFDGASESSVVLIADRIFTGLGFLTWPERRVYPDTKQRLDLYAESPVQTGAWLIEGKVVWDGTDKRLNRQRFCEGRELLGDFVRLSALPQPNDKLVVWIGFSPTGEIVRAGEAAKTMRLGDAIDAVAAAVPAARLQAQTAVNLDAYCECPDWKFAHVLCWAVA
jgi:hypothetical protein